MVSKIWGLFIILGIVFSLLTGKAEIMNKEILTSAKSSLDMMMQILPVMALWLGIMKIAEDAGLIKKISNFLSKYLHFLFPSIPKGHESLSYIASNVICNFFGLGSAATPFGLKAMTSLQKLNKNKEVASKSMITFLVLNTTGLTLFPTTILSVRMLHGSKDATSIILPCFLATLTSTIIGLFVNYILGRRYKDE
jgi:spore maturation protein A